MLRLLLLAVLRLSRDALRPILHSPSGDTYESGCGTTIFVEQVEEAALQIRQKEGNLTSDAP